MRSFFRFTTLMICGGIIVYSGWIIRQSQNPLPAPPDVQESGKAILAEQLERVRSTDFVRSPRGWQLFERIWTLLEKDRIVFTSSMLGGENALCHCDFLGGETWYFEVTLKADGNHVHLPSHQIIEIAFHEALHSLKGSYGGKASIEEECDAFVAGDQAEAALRGTEPQEVVTLEGMPVADFVKKRYLNIEQNPHYEPLSQDMEWLKKHSGL